MHGTVLVRWEQGYEEAICVVSDLPSDQAKTAWYQMRFWIEDPRDTQRGLSNRAEMQKVSFGGE